MSVTGWMERLKVWALVWTASEPVTVPQGSGDSAVLTRWGVILGLVFSLFILALAWPVLSAATSPLASGKLYYDLHGPKHGPWEQSWWHESFSPSIGEKLELTDHLGTKYSCTFKGYLDTDYDLPAHPANGDAYLINRIWWIASYGKGALGSLPLWIDP